MFYLLFSWNNTQVYARNNPVQGFPTRKTYSISLKGLKPQYSKVADPGNMSQVQLLQENLYFDLSDSKAVYINDKTKRYLEVFRDT